ncbi:hypothetical protein ACLIYM_12915 [Streptomyces fenghuangensis]|uniref:Uncharacterized protein n=1 Tax=Streptomyces chitinivorans TaxID=1257027 RepID=A0ABW7HVI0_9ACTN|nr:MULTISPECIES: hypothetical protein [Streptomyces]MDH2409375.1 hypothetical protein [Streptomyces chitinivorans]
MRNGVFVPAAVVRAAVGVLLAAAAATAVAGAPSLVRYMRIRAM